MPRLNTALTGPSYCPFLLLLRYVVLALVFFSGLLLRHASPQKSRNVLPHVELGRQRIRSRATFGEFTPTTLRRTTTMATLDGTATLDASGCWAGLVPYTADAQGSALLLCVSVDGSEWGAFLGPHDGGEEARLRAAVAALCVGTQGLLAPAGSRADETAAHLLSKLQAGKGVHRLATSSDEGVLFLTPTRRSVSCGVPVRPLEQAARVSLARGSRSWHTLSYLTDAQGCAFCREPPGVGPGGGASGRARRRRSRSRLERRAAPGAQWSQRAAGAAARRADQSRAGAAGESFLRS